MGAVGINADAGLGDPGLAPKMLQILWIIWPEHKKNRRNPPAGTFDSVANFGRIVQPILENFRGKSNRGSGLGDIVVNFLHIIAII